MMANKRSADDFPKSEQLPQTDPMENQAEETSMGDAQLRDLFQAAPYASVIADDHQRIVAVNEQALALFGYRRDEIENAKVQDLLVERLRERYSQYWRTRVYSPRENTQDDDHVWVACKRDGEEFAVQLAMNVRVHGGDILVWVAVRDVSKRMQMEAELERQHRQLLYNERMAAIGQMVTGLEHESRNTLQRSQACLSMLEHRMPKDNDCQMLVAELQDAQDHLRHLFDQVRQFAAPIYLDVAWHDLQQLAQRTWENLAADCKNTAAVFRQSCDNGEVRCLVDEFAIGRVLRNVLDNALSMSRGPLEVQMEWQAVELNGKPAYHCSICDNGPGIGENERELVFEPFFTTKTHGTGLGLPIARRLVEAHGGRLDVGDHRLRGVEFVMILPQQAGSCP